MATPKGPLQQVRGAEKAAILMLALGDEYGAQMWSLMDDEEIKELTKAMANLGAIDSGIVERLFIEFANQISQTGALVGTMDSTERLLRRILPDERVGLIMEEIRGPAGRTMWEKLNNVNEQVLASYLKNEYPQTVAVVLSKIRADHASRVLASLPDDFAMEVVQRMLRMESVQKEVLDDIEATLRNEFMSNLSLTTRRDSHEMMADIFNNFDRSTEGRFMDELEKRRQESADRIRTLMFTFEDLTKLDPSGAQTLLRHAPKEELAMALKGASETLRELFFSNMSERAAKIMREDMEAMGPVRLRDVDDAQSALVVLAKDLSDKGEIIIADAKGEDELVY